MRAKANDHRIVHTCVDEAVSGALEADGVIVAHLDRLARQLTVQEATLALV